MREEGILLHHSPSHISEFPSKAPSVNYDSSSYIGIDPRVVNVMFFMHVYKQHTDALKLVSTFPE